MSDNLTSTSANVFVSTSDNIWYGLSVITAEIEFSVPETTVVISADETIIFSLPKTTMSATANAGIVASISGTIGFPSMSMLADCAIVGGFSFNTPKLTMEAFMDAMLTAQLAVTTMTGTIENTPLVSMSFTAPKTNLVTSAINIAVPDILFDTPLTRCSMVATISSQATITGTMLKSQVVMTAINGASCTLVATLPKTNIGIQVHIDGPNEISFSLPITTLTADINNFDDETLKHVRGRVR